MSEGRRAEIEPLQTVMEEVVKYTPPGFERHDLGNGHTFHTGRLPKELMPDRRTFEAMWNLHPAEYHEIEIFGKLVPTPRWQQAYGRDYYYTGRVNKALPVPCDLVPLQSWATKVIDNRLNGILLNWYDGRLGHYIGRHRDSTKHMIIGAPIVTISFGEERIFRLRSWPSRIGKRVLDFEAPSGAVFVMPFETNLAWTHEVPAFKKWTGHRISVTLRTFDTD